MSPGFRCDCSPLTAPSVIGESCHYKIYTFYPNKSFGSEPLAAIQMGGLIHLLHGVTRPQTAPKAFHLSVLGVKLQRLHCPQHLAQPPLHGTLTATNGPNSLRIPTFGLTLFLLPSVAFFLP